MTQLVHSFGKVIPRLLSVLQSDGRNIEPALIHGDLWEQNIGIDVKTNEAMLFDPGSTYAYNEVEFRTWRCSWAKYFRSLERTIKKPACDSSWRSGQDHRQDSVYLRQYKAIVPESEPRGEWDDRNRLYSLHPNLNNSAGPPDSKTAKDSRAT
jgi:protein-ribulosamine 3-kinase